MSTRITSLTPSRRLQRRLALGLALAVTALGLPSAQAAAEKADKAGKADKAQKAEKAGKSGGADASTPALTVSFERQARGEGAPYVLKVTNAAEKPLKLKGQVLLSVAAHNQDRARQLPEQELRPGQSRTIEGLAAHDRVMLESEGYSALTLIVPEKK